MHQGALIKDRRYPFSKQVGYPQRRITFDIQLIHTEASQELILLQYIMSELAKINKVVQLAFCRYISI